MLSNQIQHLLGVVPRESQYMRVVDEFFGWFAGEKGKDGSMTAEPSCTTDLSLSVTTDENLSLILTFAWETHAH